MSSTSSWPRPSWWGKNVLTTREASDYLGISIRTLKRWRGRNYGPPYFRPANRTGAARYLLADLIAFMESAPPLRGEGPYFYPNSRRNRTHSTR